MKKKFFINNNNKTENFIFLNYLKFNKLVKYLNIKFNLY